MQLNNYLDDAGPYPNSILINYEIKEHSLQTYSFIFSNN